LTRYLLDTNLISDPVKPHPSATLAAWLSHQADEDLFISVVAIAETRRGILRLPSGRRRDRLETWFSGPTSPERVFEGRVLPFDKEAALIWAELMNGGDAAGRPRVPLDRVIASIALADGCVVATGNERHFQDVVPMINPLREAA